MFNKTSKLIKALHISDNVFVRPIKISTNLARKLFSISVISVFALLSACGTSTPATRNNLPPTAGSPASTSVPSLTDTPLPAATTSAASLPPQTGKTTSLNPCQLISSQEASTLTGVQFKTGLEGTLPGGGKTCSYNSTSQSVFQVEVVQAPDIATADAAKAKFLTDLQAKMQQLSSQGINVTQLPNFADGALTVQTAITYNGETINGSAFAFRKGTIFIAFSDTVVGKPAPSSTIMQSEANMVLGRLP